MANPTEISNEQSLKLPDSIYDNYNDNESCNQPESELSYPEIIDTEQASASPKRRKIDKDGFLCPATPDIPITSCQYGLPRLNEQEHEDTANEYQQQSYEAEEIQLQSDDLPSEHITDTKDRSGMSVAEMVQDLGEENKMLYNQWSNMFRESENFENFCPVRLDKMIEQAKQLEESLIKQKQLLCTRLNVISHIIRTSISEGPGGDH